MFKKFGIKIWNWISNVTYLHVSLLNVSFLKVHVKNTELFRTYFLGDKYNIYTHTYNY